MKNASELRSQLSAIDLDPGYFCKFVKDQYVRKTIKFEQLKNILDIGCDTGYMSGLLQHDHYSCHYLGVDVSNNFNDDYLRDENHAFVMIDDTLSFLHTLQRSKTKFDCVLMLDVIEHFNNKEHGIQALLDASQLVDLGGFLFLSTPNSQHGKINWPKYHQYEYSFEELRQVIVDKFANFSVYTCFGWSMSDDTYETHFEPYSSVLPKEVARVLKAIDHPRLSRDIMIVLQRMYE